MIKGQKLRGYMAMLPCTCDDTSACNNCSVMYQLLSDYVIQKYIETDAAVDVRTLKDKAAAKNIREKVQKKIVEGKAAKTGLSPYLRKKLHETRSEAMKNTDFVKAGGSGKVRKLIMEFLGLKGSMSQYSRDTIEQAARGRGYNYNDMLKEYKQQILDDYHANKIATSKYVGEQK